MSGSEYGVLGKQLWHICDSGVASGKWVLFGGARVVAWVVGTGGCDWMCAMTIGIFNWCKVSCVQKFAFTILAALIAISMLATHTWCANVGPLPSSSKFVNM